MTAATMTARHARPEDPSSSWRAAYLIGLTYVAVSVAYLVVRVWAW